jgi:hypothetical protein
MYHQDPFRARKQLLERRAEAAAKREKAQKANDEPKVAKEFIHAPEVKMGSQLRIMVEEVIKKVCPFHLKRPVMCQTYKSESERNHGFR